MAIVNLTPVDRAILLTIHSENTRGVWAPLDTLGATLGFSERPFARTIDAMRAKGLLTISDGKAYLTDLGRQTLNV